MVALLTPACSAIASMLTADRPRASIRSVAAARIAWRAGSLRGRPRDFPAPGAADSSLIRLAYGLRDVLPRTRGPVAPSVFPLRSLGNCTISFHINPSSRTIHGISHRPTHYSLGVIAHRNHRGRRGMIARRGLPWRSAAAAVAAAMLAGALAACSGSSSAGSAYAPTPASASTAPGATGETGAPGATGAPGTTGTAATDPATSTQSCV